MKGIQRIALAVAVLALFSTGLFAAPCTLATDVTSLPSCNIGSLVFSNFTVTPVVGSTTITITSYDTSTSDIKVNFGTLPLSNGADVHFAFLVTGGVLGFDLFNGGTSGTNGQGQNLSNIEEKNCSAIPGTFATFASNGICTQINMAAGQTSNGNPLVTADINKGGGQDNPEVIYRYATGQSSVYVWKDIGTITGGGLSSFTESFLVPEPVTTILFGSGLLALGCLRFRKNRKS